MLLKKRIRDAGSAVLRTKNYDWETGPAISGEIWGDHWIGFDNGVFIARLRQSVIQPGNLSWTTAHTNYNNVHNLPRCTGATRYRFRGYYVGDTTVQGEHFRFHNLPSGELLSYSPLGPTYCDDQYTGPIPANTHDGLDERNYNARAQLAMLTMNGVRTDYTYDVVGNVERIVAGIDASHSMNFAYDDLDRLTHGSGAWGSLHCEYNASGDRTLERSNSRNTTYTYDSSGHLEQLSGRISLDFTFDSFGHARQRGPLRYDYDLEDRITSVTDAQSNSIIA